jgi:hypothetical protein
MPKARLFDGKKFMWDGEEYDSEEKASAREKEYAEKGFDVQSLREDGKISLYTRRIVTEIVLD